MTKRRNVSTLREITTSKFCEGIANAVVKLVSSEQNGKFPTFPNKGQIKSLTKKGLKNMFDLPRKLRSIIMETSLKKLDEVRCDVARTLVIDQAAVILKLFSGVLSIVEVRVPVEYWKDVLIMNRKQLTNINIHDDVEIFNTLGSLPNLVRLDIRHIENVSCFLRSSLPNIGKNCKKLRELHACLDGSASKEDAKRFCFTDYPSCITKNPICSTLEAFNCSNTATSHLSGFIFVILKNIPRLRFAGECEMQDIVFGTAQPFLPCKLEHLLLDLQLKSNAPILDIQKNFPRLKSYKATFAAAHLQGPLKSAFKFLLCEKTSWGNLSTLQLTNIAENPVMHLDFSVLARNCPNITTLKYKNIVHYNPTPDARVCFFRRLADLEIELYSCFDHSLDILKLAYGCLRLFSYVLTQGDSADHFVNTMTAFEIPSLEKLTFQIGGSQVMNKSEIVKICDHFPALKEFGLITNLGLLESLQSEFEKANYEMKFCGNNFVHLCSDPDILEDMFQNLNFHSSHPVILEDLFQNLNFN